MTHVNHTGEKSWTRARNMLLFERCLGFLVDVAIGTVIMACGGPVRVFGIAHAA